MQDDEDGQEFGERPPSKSSRKREATAAQKLGQRLIALNNSELEALGLPERLLEAILLAKRITKRGGLARQHQFIGKLMRDVDPAPLEAALDASARGGVFDANRHKSVEAWRARLLTEGPRALDDLVKWRPQADRKSLQALIAKATNERVDSGSRDGASRQLFRAVRELFDAGQDG